MKHLCDNCGKTFVEKKLKEIKDLLQRVEPGRIVPSGECPECGALCYPENGTRRYVLHVVGCVDPLLAGPFLNAPERDAKARELRQKFPDSDAFFWLDVSPDGKPEIGAYSAGFMEGKPGFEEEPRPARLAAKRKGRSTTP